MSHSVDEILISGSSEQENVERLQIVLSQLMEVGLRLKKEKCVFMVTEVDYLSFKVDAEGLHLLPEKVCRSSGNNGTWVGSSPCFPITPNMATMLAVFYQLLRKGEWWRWS